LLPLTKTLIPIVEGQSEVESAGILLRRLLEKQAIHDIVVAKPFRVKRDKVVRDGELEKAIRQAERSRENSAGLLVLLDVDDDCAAELGPKLQQRVSGVSSLPATVVLAEMEFEAWLLGAQESLRGVRGIDPDAELVSNPQNIRDAKGALSRLMKNRRYIPVDDQPALVSAMDLGLAEDRCLPSRNWLDLYETLLKPCAADEWPRSTYS